MPAGNAAGKGRVVALTDGERREVEEYSEGMCGNGFTGRG